MCKRACAQQQPPVVIFSDLDPELVAMYMDIYKDGLRARLRLREYFCRVVMREFRDEFLREFVFLFSRPSDSNRMHELSGMHEARLVVHEERGVIVIPTNPVLKLLKKWAREKAAALLRDGPFLGPPSTHGGSANANSSDLIYRKRYLTRGRGF